MVEDNLQQVKQQTAQVRTQLEAQKESAKKSIESLVRVAKKLPSRVSQRALRQQFEGLKGRIKRRGIKKVEERVEVQRGKITEFEKGLTEFEETKLKPAETEIKRVEEFNQALENVKKADAKGKLSFVVMYGEGLEQKIAQEFQRRKDLDREQLKKQIVDFEASNPGEIVNVDWEKLKIRGVQSGALGKTLSVKQYNKEIKKLEEIRIEEIPADMVEVPIQPVLEVREVIKPSGFLKGLQFELSQKTQQRRTEQLRGDVSIKKSVTGLGEAVAVSVLGTTIFAKELVTQDPIKTTKQVGTGLVILGKKVVSGEGFPEAGRILRQDPLFAFGIVGTEILTAKGLGAISQPSKLRKASALRKLEKAPPEIFLGFERGGETTRILVGGIRKKGEVEAKTITRFDVLKLGEDTFQVQKGVGIQKITKKGKPISTEEFTFFGEAERGVSRIVKKEDIFKISREVTEPTSAFVSDIKILTRGKEPELLKSVGVSLQKQEGKITKVLSFPAKKGIRLKTGETRIINLDTGKVIIKDKFGNIKVRTPIKDVDSIGIIKRIGKEKGGETIIIQRGQVIKLDKGTAQVGGAIGLQIESKILKVSRKGISEKPFIPAFAPSPQVQIVEQKAKVISVPSQQVRQEVRQIPILDLRSGLMQKQISETRFKAIQDIKLKSVVQEKARIAQRPATRLIQLLGQKTKQVIAKPIPKIVKPTPKIAKPFPIPTKSKTPFLDILKGKKGEFKVKVRKGGKDIKIGEAKTKQEAKELLLERLKTTLRASGFVERGGKKVSVGFLGEGFRQSRKDPLRVVEIRRKRIKRKGKSQEAKEIQFFRKQRGSKANFF